MSSRVLHRATPWLHRYPGHLHRVQNHVPVELMTEISPVAFFILLFAIWVQLLAIFTTLSFIYFRLRVLCEHRDYPR